MSLYLTLKWLHIISSVLLVGTGLGSAFYMFFTNRSGSICCAAVTISRFIFLGLGVGSSALCALVWGVLWFSFEYLSTGLLVLE